MTKKKDHEAEPAEADEVDAAIACVTADLEKELKTGTRGAQMKATEAGQKFNPIDLLPALKALLELWRSLRGQQGPQA